MFSSRPKTPKGKKKYVQLSNRQARSVFLQGFRYDHTAAVWSSKYGRLFSQPLTLCSIATSAFTMSRKSSLEIRAWICLSMATLSTRRFSSRWAVDTSYAEWCMSNTRVVWRAHVWTTSSRYVGAMLRWEHAAATTVSGSCGKCGDRCLTMVAIRAGAWLLSKSRMRWVRVLEWR